MDISLESRKSSVDRLQTSHSFSRPVTFHYEIQNHTTRMQKLTKAFKVYRLTLLTLLCLFAGLAIGLLSRPYAQNWSERQFMYVKMPGELYLRFLKLMIIPLLASNVILSFGTIQGKLSSHLCKIASFLYLGSNLISIIIAIILAILICPGKKSEESTTMNIINNLENAIQTDNHQYLNEYHNLLKRSGDYHQPAQILQTKNHKEQEDKKVIDNTQKLSRNLLNLAPSSTPIDESSAIVEHEKNKSLQIKLANSALQSDNYITNDNNDDDNYTSNDDESNLQVRFSASNNASFVNTAYHNGLSSKLPIDVLLDVLRNLVPDSIVGASMQQVRTRLFAPKELVIRKNGTTDPSPSRWPIALEKVDQANIIGLLAISIFTGVILSHMKETSKPMLDLCACVAELSLRIGMMAINIAPLCIMFLLIGQVARSHDLGSIAGELCMYSITVLIGLVLHGFIILPLIYYLITKKSPIEFLVSMLEALVASFATSSSSATLALMLNCLTEFNLNPVIVRAFGPLGSVFNMNGTAIYEVIGAIFIAQTLGVTLPLTSLLLVGLSSAVASLSTTGIPSSGMMTLVIVLDAINLPVFQLSLIYIVDFIIDRFRTVINVWSGAIVCALINHICPEHLFEEDMDPDQYREMVKYRAQRCTFSRRKSLSQGENLKPQIISVTITPPLESSCM